MKNILAYITIFSILLFINCKKTTKEPTEISQEIAHHGGEITVTQAQFESNHMKLGTLTKQNFPEIVKTTGMIDVPPQNKEVITTFSGGYVKNSALLVGDKVKKGQALIIIENLGFVEIQQEYLEISEQLNFLKNEYERQKTLFEEQITSQKIYLKAQSNYKTKLAMYNGVRKKLRMLNINPSSVEQGKITSTITLYASISGSVTKVNVSKGSYVSSEDEIMEIVNTDHIHIELAVFEKDVMHIKKGQRIVFEIPEATTDVFEAEVHLVGASIDKISRTTEVHGHLHDDEKNTFSIGMFVDAGIVIASRQAMAAPEYTVVEDEGKMYVLVLEKQENKSYAFKKVEVKIGKKYNGYTEVLSGSIKPTDKILIKGAFSLVGGSE